MGLDYLHFENYKCFSKPENIQIRPLTILIGRNSAGKSVIARLPILLSHSLGQRSEAPLDLHFDGLDYGSTTVDLIYDRIPHGSLTVGASVTHSMIGPQSFSAKIQHFDEYKLQVVTEFKCRSRSHDQSLIWVGNDPKLELPIYRISETDEKATVEFRGLFPHRMTQTEVSSEEREPYRDLMKMFRMARNSCIHGFGSVNYLGPFRKAPERTYRFPTSITKSVGFSGSAVADLLGEDDLRRNGKILAAVNEWVKANLGGWELAIGKQADYFSIVLRKPGSQSVEVNIADVGTGIAQVLPLIVQRMLGTEAGNESGIEIVEQPELHLHPAVHGDVADLYVLAAKTAGTRLLIETHSENFVLRVRRWVALGKLDPSSVIIYWIEDTESGSRINPIHIDEQGEVDTWPTGVFSEDFDEVRAIRKAQKSR